MISVGTKAPGFLLKDNRNKDVRLSDFSGKKILLSFHPLAWTKICGEQMKSLENNLDLFEKNNSVAMGISVDAMPSKNAWAKSLDIHNTRLLADFWPHAEVAKLYGVFRETEGVSERANILIDENQFVIFAKTYPTGVLPDISEVISAIMTSDEDALEMRGIKDANTLC